MFDLNVDISSENYNNWCDTHPIIDLEKPELSRNPNDSTELSVSGVSTTSSIIINGVPPPPSDDRESHGHMQYSIATTKLVDCKYDDSGFEDNSLEQQQGESVVTRKLFPVDEISRGGGWNGPVVGSCEKGVGESDNWLKLSVSDSKTTASSTNVGVYHCNSMMRPVTALQQQKPQQVIRKSRRGPRSRSSQYRGVTFYRRTGRWESHIWDCGKQVYLGGFDTAHAAARAYDRAAIKFRGVDADINFHVADYEEDMNRTKDLSKEEFVRILRRQGTTFPRRSSSLSRHNNNIINREGGVISTNWHKFGLQSQPQQQVYLVGTNEGKLAHLTNHGGIITSRDTSLNLNLGISSAPVIAQGKHDCSVVPSHLIYQHLHAFSKYPAAGGERKTLAFHGIPTMSPSSTSQQPYHTFLSTGEKEDEFVGAHHHLPTLMRKMEFNR